MATNVDVLTMLIPNGGWIAVGEDYEGIQFLECEPISKAEFMAGFPQYDAWKAEQDARVAANKAELIAKLGITADEAKLLLS